MAGPKTDSTGRIQQQPAGAPKQPRSLLDLLRDPTQQAKLAMALPKRINPDRMLRIAMTAVGSTPNLALCDQTSFLGCLLQASQLGLEVNTPLGHAYLIPRRNKQNGYACTLIIGYQGMIELALRSGKVTGIRTLTVRQGDLFIYEDGLDPVLKHTPASDAEREARPITHIIAIARMSGADSIFLVLTRAQIDARMRRSESVNSSYSPWKTDYEAMAQKTGVRALFKWIPKSPEMAMASHLEEAHERGDKQAFDHDVAHAIETVGFEVPIAQGEDFPVPEDDGSTDPVTGETIGEHKPGTPQPS